MPTTDLISNGQVNANAMFQSILGNVALGINQMIEESSMSIVENPFFDNKPIGGHGLTLWANEPYIGFASGPHMCLGMHLARMETKVVLDALLDRLPNLRFAPDADPYISGLTFRAPPTLDVEWG